MGINCSINQCVIGYHQKFTGTQTNTENKEKHEETHTLSNDKIGSNSTKIARKGIKYAWHRTVNYLKKLFNNNKEVINDAKDTAEILYDIHSIIKDEDSKKEITPATYDYNA